ncbi:DUF1491 family protein [Acetobacter conturbans]|uniref:DUF1491 family protein n=1 Tax=Acetobacter conturbans TaxID=1737472 RepID=A0ABX0JZZ0_9PROT|nr:DUF1491 family protein [Acetobacter conturbans]NHN88131.1 DUF1491 family protein [Acetobacter conturbans]
MSEEPRLKTALWVSAVLRQANASGHPAFRRRRGYEDAGGVLVILGSRDRRAVVLTQTRDADGAMAWMKGSGVEPVTESEAEAYVERQVKRDPDLWVLEIEADDFEPPFEARII